MKKNILQILFLLFTCPVFAQSSNTINEIKISSYEVLPDKGYSLNEILKDKTLPFKQTDSLVDANSYWVRLLVFNSIAEERKYIITVYPNINTSIYHFDAQSGKWIVHFSRLNNRKNLLLLGKHPYRISALSRDTFYIKIDVNGPNSIDSRFKLKIIFTPEADEISGQQTANAAWLVAFVVLILFIFNNLIIYLGTRDKTILYYIMTQFGAIFYLTAYYYLFDFGSYYLFSSMLFEQFRFYDINALLMHLGIVLVFFGLVQLTRNYLNIKQYLPLDDRLLRFSLYIYVALSIIIALINIFGFYLENYTIKADNAYCSFLIFLIIYISLKAYHKKIPLSKPFLFANLLPLIFVLFIPIYHIITSGHSTWLPIAAVISQALGFSIALLTRTKALEQALKLNELESQQLEFNMKEVLYLNKLNALEIEQKNAEISIEKNRNENLQLNLELNQRELASSALNMVQKSELLTLLKEQIQKLNWMDRYHTKKNVEELNELLQSNIQLDSDWDKFKLHFEQVHPQFFNNLKTLHPSLTAKEIRLYTYFEMKLSHKEIAALLAIDQASVRRAKTRLVKKMAQT
ncbi:hypothetical protein A5893_12430 [Pedobacter psychrophilus]|uniref:7TM-DISM receptor extracellular domain-containing protein n=1 Tax=Pedobacter psychrophilus TaxID=1826909 RepID=A0A179DCS7_9SPHI|nr:7TM-DISM domain-containing protein [Pedobacter psychrophilus]OAQ38845.1 hypothetical protein A5893_12430 [Pedobacter psychrophilus]